MVDCFGYLLLILWLEQSSRQFSPPPTLSCETVMSNPSGTVMSTPPLPCETLTTICEFLFGPTSGAIDEHLSRGDLFNCSLVSRGWRAAALPLLWETLAVYCGESEDVDIDSGSSESNDDIWPMLADSLVVECASAARDTDPLDEGLRTWHPNFDNFHISQSPRFLQNSVVRALADFYPNLRSLKLTFLRELWDREPPCTVISDQSLCFLIDSCPHLRHLELRKVSDLSNRFLIHCAQHASNLRWLWIEQRGVQLTGEGVVDMSGWKQCLEFIDIRCGNRGGAKMDKAFVKAMGTNFKNLRFCQLGKISRGIRN
ncbi:hypothetical protein BC938DRAFT_477287 [Jimgerdemannia flammicorona]|uniref:F-box domain-containing protein n=1 Tax=Jimgerdemannia flammicorona TaxID=994334 RepID=A0A433QPK6_9FUNG|nr:hypothetical protein BC938DRAFT_477287 [Jimgerdemannia flammicorona]